MNNSKSNLSFVSRVSITLVFSIGISFAAENDVLFISVEQLSAKQLVTAVLNRNADIPAMEAAWRSAQSYASQANAFDDPMLSYQFAPQTIGQSNIDFGQKISISQRLPWSGKRELRANIAKHEAEASAQGVAKARLRLTEATQRNYADWYFVHAALRINRINQDLLNEFKHIAEIKYAAGRASKQDVLRAEVEVALLEHREIVLNRQKREVLSGINTLLQRLPDMLLPAPGNLISVNELSSIVKLRQQALENHPGLRALQANILANRQRHSLSDRDFYPDITLVAGYNSLMSLDERRLTVGASINVPLQEKRRSKSHITREKILQLRAEKKSKIAQIQDAVQRAYEKVHETTATLKLYQNKLVPLATESLAAAKSDYQSGHGGFLELIIAEKYSIQTLLQREKLKADYHRRIAMLEYTISTPLNFPFRNTGSYSK